MESERTQAHRCPSCGSRLPTGARACRICGAAVPFRLSRIGTVAESALIVVALAALGGLYLWSRHGDPARVVTGPDGTPVVLVAAPPSDLPPPTLPPSPTPTRPVNTPRPPTPTPLPETVTHVVASGDTLYGIAQRYGVTADVIVEVNGLDRPDALSIGQQLLVPMPRASGEGVTAATDAPPDSMVVTTTTGVDLAVAGVATAEGPPAPTPPRAPYDAPLCLAPTGGEIVTSEAPSLRWASVGVLPAGVSYVVSIREQGESDDDAQQFWIQSNATALRLPSPFRPSLGATRDIEWTVTVRRRGRRLIGIGASDVILSAAPTWQAFTWSPGSDAATP